MNRSLLVLLAACGPGLAARDRKPELRTSLVAASGDAAAIARMLRGSVIDGGVWFVDRNCRLQFPHAEELKETRLQAFATCLAGLHWRASEREDQLGDVVVLTYAPGFEIEARVVREEWGPRIAWIGVESMRDANDGLPTISSDALEALRTSGDRNGPVTATLEPEQYAWLKVCIDEKGEVKDADSRTMTSIAAADAFAAAAKTWTFKPFVADGQALPVCAMVRPTYRAEHVPKVETLPLPAPPSRSGKRPIVFSNGAKTVEAHRLQGRLGIFPADQTKIEIQSAGVSKVVGVFRLCLDDTGHPESILPLQSTGFADYDRRLIAGMQQWVYSPFLRDGEPQPVCTAVTFIYNQH